MAGSWVAANSKKGVCLSWAWRIAEGGSGDEARSWWGGVDASL